MLTKICLNKAFFNSMGKKIKKLRIQLILTLIGLLKTIGLSLMQFFVKLWLILTFLLSLITRSIIVPLFPLYLKIKKIIKGHLFSLHYQGGFLSFLTKQRLLAICLVLFLIFIFFEGRLSLQDDIFAEAMAASDSNQTNVDFIMAAADEQVVLKPVCFFDYNFIPTRTETEKYVVQPGDTATSIARKFGISINTILWENNLSPYSIIRPGQSLKILPTTGLSYKIKSGDTIAKIAKTYKSTEQTITAFNNLEGTKLVAGQIIIIPDGIKPAPPPAPAIFRRTTPQEKTWLAEAGGTTRTGTGCRNFVAGQCTYYVAQKYCITFSGHAKSWLANASRAGYAIGKTPQVGAIVSIKESYYGHVAIVEEVRENTIVISEMNHLGPWKVNKREIAKNSRLINGYIYP